MMYRLAIVGAGAVGGTLAAYLTEAGADVTLITRGESLKRITRGGAVLKNREGERRVEVKATGRVDGRYDVVIYATKSYQLSAAASAVKMSPSREAFHLSLQNGLGNEEVLREIFGGDRSLTGVIYISAERPEAGVFIHHSGGHLILGSLWPTEEKIEALEELSRVIKRTPLGCRVEKDIRYWIYRKLLWNASFNPVTALLDLSIEEVMKNPFALRVIRGAMEEVLSLARASGVGMEEELIEKTIEATGRMGGGPTSMLSDLRAGKRLEVDSILKRPLKEGRRLGIEMPTVRTLLNLLLSHPRVSQKG